MESKIVRPLITEKNTVHNARGVYVFEVKPDASKDEIMNDVEKSFGVKVNSVRTANCRGRAKVTKFGYGRTPKWKKAFVQLKAGEKIALFEGV